MPAEEGMTTLDHSTLLHLKMDLLQDAVSDMMSAL